MNDNYIKETAKTIMAQLGCNAGMGFARVTGSRNFTCGQDEKGRPYLRFSLCRDLKNYLPDAKVVPNRCTVFYDACSDDYDMVFERYTAARRVFDRKKVEWRNYPSKLVVTNKHEGIYCSDLQPTFEEHTGLILDFCRVRWTT